MPKWILLYRMRIDLVMNYWMKPVADEETIHQHTTNRQGNIFLVLIPFNISNSISTTRQTNDRRCWKKMPSTTSINCRFVVCHSFSVGFFFCFSSFLEGAIVMDFDDVRMCAAVSANDIAFFSMNRKLWPRRKATLSMRTHSIVRRFFSVSLFWRFEETGFSYAMWSLR